MHVFFGAWLLLAIAAGAVAAKADASVKAARNVRGRILLRVMMSSSCVFGFSSHRHPMTRERKIHSNQTDKYLVNKS
jgi:hypothetical protein